MIHACEPGKCPKSLPAFCVWQLTEEDAAFLTDLMDNHKAPPTRPVKSLPTMSHADFMKAHNNAQKDKLV